jgi:hypothetical protein
MTVFPYANPIYQPAIRIVSNITRSNPVVITTSQDHLYVSGTIVRIDIPFTPIGGTSYGMQQINQQFGPITVLTDITFSLPINSTQFDPYLGPSSLYTQQAQSVPIGENTDQLNAAVQNVLIT